MGSEAGLGGGGVHIVRDGPGGGRDGVVGGGGLSGGLDSGAGGG